MKLGGKQVPSNQACLPVFGHVKPGDQFMPNLISPLDHRVDARRIT
jgi:hypothetical protein